MATIAFTSGEEILVASSVTTAWSSCLQDIRIDGGGGEHGTFHVCGLGNCLAAPVSQGHDVAAAVGGAALAGDVTVGFQPAQCLAHGLRLYTHQLGKLGLGHRSVDGEHFHRDDPGMGQANGPQFFVPGVFNKACCRGQ